MRGIKTLESSKMNIEHLCYKHYYTWYLLITAYIYTDHRQTLILMVADVPDNFINYCITCKMAHLIMNTFIQFPLLLYKTDHGIIICIVSVIL